MDIGALKIEFYQCIKTALYEFSKIQDNKEVFAMVLDCDSEVGGVWLRYNNKAHFKKELPKYQEYLKKYGWEIYGLYGSEYEPGNFASIEYQKTKFVEHFTNSYYYHSIGDYFGEGKPILNIKENYKDVFWEMVLETINKLKLEIKDIGIDITSDFIFFCCDHDQSDEERKDFISKTVDKELIDKLTIKS